MWIFMVISSVVILDLLSSDFRVEMWFSLVLVNIFVRSNTYLPIQKIFAYFNPSNAVSLTGR